MHEGTHYQYTHTLATQQILGKTLYTHLILTAYFPIFFYGNPILKPEYKVFFYCNLILKTEYQVFFYGNPILKPEFPVFFFGATILSPGYWMMWSPHRYTSMDGTGLRMMMMMMLG